MKDLSLYWILVRDYSQGKGLRLSENNMNKADIADFALFCMKFLKENIAQAIIADILSRVSQYEKDKP